MIDVRLQLDSDLATNNFLQKELQAVEQKLLAEQKMTTTFLETSKTALVCATDRARCAHPVHCSG